MTEARFLLDSNICIYLLNGDASILSAKVAQQVQGSLAISAVTLADIGVRYGADVASDAGLRSFLTAVAVLPFGTVEAEIYAALPFRRARFDRLIAAQALALKLTVVTNNEADFADIPGLLVENWTR